MFKQTFGGREYVRVTLVGSLGRHWFPVPQTKQEELSSIDHGIVTIITAVTTHRPEDEPDVVVCSVERYERSFAIGLLGRTEARALNAISDIVGYAGAAFLEDYNVVLHGGAYSLETVAGE